MQKVFISQIMKNRTNKEILKERREIREFLNLNMEEEFEIIDSFFKEEPKVKEIPVWYLGESIKLLSEADVAVFGKGWEKGRGTLIEHEVCMQYKIKTLEL